jgi:hypothetical protein
VTNQPTPRVPGRVRARAAALGLGEPVGAHRERPALALILLDVVLLAGGVALLVTGVIGGSVTLMVLGAVCLALNGLCGYLIALVNSRRLFLFEDGFVSTSLRGGERLAARWGQIGEVRPAWLRGQPDLATRIFTGS